MSNLFNQVWNWVSVNRDIIDLVIGAAIFIFVVLVEIFTAKNKKAINAVKDSISKLSKVVEDYETLRDELVSLSETINGYDVTANKSIDKIVNVQDVDTQMLKKLNTVLDIMGLAYSTIKNDEIRLGIANMINYAKYLDPTNKLIQEREAERTKERRSQAYEKIKDNLKNNMNRLRDKDSEETKQVVAKNAPVQNETKPKTDVIKRY